MYSNSNKVNRKLHHPPRNSSINPSDKSDFWQHRPLERALGLSGWKPIIRPWDGDSWKTIKAFPILDEQLDQRWRNNVEIIGLGFSFQGTRCGAIDIDSGSNPYHTIDKVNEIKAALETIGITRTILIQSSSSEGWHLWYALPEWVNPDWLARTVYACLQNSGFTIKDGQLEIFPNVRKRRRKGCEFKRIRLPLQKDSYVLDEDGNYCHNNKDFFLQQLKFCAQGQDIDLLNECLLASKELYFRQTNKKVRQRWHSPAGATKLSGHSSKALERYEENLTLLLTQGWGMLMERRGPNKELIYKEAKTNNILGAVAEYGVVFQNITDLSALTSYIEQTARGIPGFEQHSRHLHELSKRCEDWAKTALRYRYPKQYRGQLHLYQNDLFDREASYARYSYTDNSSNVSDSSSIPPSLSAGSLASPSFSFDIAPSTSSLRKTNFMSTTHSNIQSQKGFRRNTTRSSLVVEKIQKAVKATPYTNQLISEYMAQLRKHGISQSSLTKYKKAWHPKYLCGWVHAARRHKVPQTQTQQAPKPPKPKSFNNYYLPFLLMNTSQRSQNNLAFFVYDLVMLQAESAALERDNLKSVG